jgi:cytosine/uracil/thiamine/allantoin permease
MDLQVFNQGRIGGRYWFRNGVNWRGMVAWIPSALVGLLFANYPPLIVGPFRNVAGGVDLSLVVAIGLAAVVYVALLFAFPEPRYVFGPDGPRLVPCANLPMPAVEDDHRASAHRVRMRSEERLHD